MFDLLRTVQVVLGIGLVIFVHELGHFVAARLCRVRVEVFSLGFGPKIFGWRRGATLYQVALVPVGGYVKMAGDEGRAEGEPPATDALWSKPVGQRFFIYSGGVLMNVLTAALLFPALLAHGVPFTQPVIGEVAPGSPAWHARIPEGARVLSVNGKPAFEFSHVPMQVALGDPARAELELEIGPEKRREHVVLAPRFEPRFGHADIGVGPPLDPDLALVVAPDGPAARAGIQAGDRLIGFAGALDGLPLVPQLEYAMQRREPMELRVAGPPDRGGERTVRVEAETGEAQSAPRLGILTPRNHVADVRADSELAGSIGLQRDDRLLRVGATPIRRFGDLEQALLELRSGGTLTVRRGVRELELALPPLTRAAALGLISDLAVREDLESTELVVSAGEAAAQAGVRDGDRVVRIDETPVTRWSDVRDLVEKAGAEGRALALQLERPGDAPGAPPSQLRLEVKPEAQPVATYGFGFAPARYVYRAASLLEATRVGLYCSWSVVQDAWLILKRIALGQVSGDAVGGPIAIYTISYTLAGEGLAKLFFFLALLSMNLAFLNVLPIPVLDGGHLLFLLIEKLKGSPVSERVLGYSQVVGIALIVSLMVIVTFNDIMRVFKPD